MRSKIVSRLALGLPKVQAINTFALTIPTEKLLEHSPLKFPHPFAGPTMVVSRSLANSLQDQS